MPIDPQTLRATRTKVEPDSYLNRVPNRNLTEEDWQLFDADQRAEVRKSELYEVKTNDEVKAEAAQADEPATPRRAAHESTPAPRVVSTTDQTPSG